MGKRPRSPSPAHRHLSDLFALPELFLHVLSFLSPADLARAQAVNRHWQRMVTDQGLWKALYLEKYSHPHHSRLVHTPSGRSTPRLRPIARLPSRAFPPPSPSPSAASREGDEEGGDVRFEGVDWKGMMRLGTNWSNGNVLAEASVPLPPTPAATPQEPDRVSQQHLALFPSFIACSLPTSPLVHVYTAAGESLGLVPPPPGWSSPSRPDNVSCIAADQAVTPSEEGHVPARLGIFYASGGFAIVRLRLDNGRLAWVRESVSTARTPPRRRGHSGPDPVVLAAMHSPLLVTCTLTFRLGIYILGRAEPTLVRSLRSDVSFHPASLSLLPAAGGFRGALTFTTPVYPSSWTVAVQELHIDTSSTTTVHRGECHHIHAKWDKDAWPRRIEPVPGVRGPIGVGSDGRWCVLAGQDSVIHVYALPADTRPETDATPEVPELELEGITHAHTLLAPAGGVGAISLAAGRCVSGGGGKVLVWELDSVEREEGEASIGTARGGYVEVKAGGRRKVDEESAEPESKPGAKTGTEAEAPWTLPNPRSISSAARRIFLARPPASLPPDPQPSRRAEGIRHLAFDEEKIVGMVGDVMRIWSFK